jgi:PadR family transcriptional regulator PadR
LNVQYKKGVLELCVMSLLHQKDCYGYDLSEVISGKIDISDGTVYPILRKMKSDGLVTTYLSEDSGGPPRKYYRLTDMGRAEYRRARGEWLSFAKAVEELLWEDNNETA